MFKIGLPLLTIYIYIYVVVFLVWPLQVCKKILSNLCIFQMIFTNAFSGVVYLRFIGQNGDVDLSQGLHGFGGSGFGQESKQGVWDGCRFNTKTLEKPLKSGCRQHCIVSKYHPLVEVFTFCFNFFFAVFWFAGCKYSLSVKKTCAARYRGFWGSLKSSISPSTDWKSSRGMWLTHNMQARSR